MKRTVMRVIHGQSIEVTLCPPMGVDPLGRCWPNIRPRFNAVGGRVQPTPTMSRQELQRDW